MEIIQVIDQPLSQFTGKCQQLFSGKNYEKVNKACTLAQEVLGNRKFPSGETILYHSLEVASIVAEEIGLESDSVVVGILHNVLYDSGDSKVTREKIIADFGEPVVRMLEGMAKIKTLGTDTVELHPENFRMLMLALAGDVRVILIKIADRLQTMRKFDQYPVDTIVRVAMETSHIYAPLAHRLGLYKLHSELQDLCLKYLKPEAYQEVILKLKETENERSRFTAEFVRPIEEKLRSRGFRFDMKARTKSVFSIYNKMQKQNVPFDEVYDLFAIRVILDSEPDNEKADCWTVYSVVTDEYQANPERMRDWITIPKSSGYESLHATVMGPHKKWIEVQIRTRRMDDMAERGLAAHWKYKGGKENKELDQWLTSIRDILENPDVNVVDFIDEFRTNVYSEEIYVFTPKGDLKKLPKGATILDFAYDIHSDLGDKCVGGKVNDRKVTLRHKLRNGDTVSVETSSNQKPKIDWLDFVVTSRAKTRIKASLNEARKLDAAIGKEELARKFKNWKIELTDDIIRKLLKFYGFKLAADLYYNIAIGKIDTLNIKSLVKEEEKQSVRTRLEEILPVETAKDLAVDSGDDFMIIDSNIKNVNYKLAPCCNPVYGDDIFGFVTIHDGIKIHRVTCPNAPQMIERFPYRLVKARWKPTSTKSSFLTTLFITGADSIDIVSEISHVIAKDFGVQMRAINIESDKGEFKGILKIWVHNVDHLEFLIHKLKHMKGVTSVSRGDH
jgi:GTP pyrophosphokinase